MIFVEDFRNMDLSGCQKIGLIYPVGIFSVIFRSEVALNRNRSTPGAKMPRSSAHGGGWLPWFIELVSKIEVDDGASVAF